MHKTMANKTITDAFTLLELLRVNFSDEAILDELVNVIPGSQLYEYLDDVADNFDFDRGEDDIEQIVL